MYVLVVDNTRKTFWSFDRAKIEYFKAIDNKENEIVILTNEFGSVYLQHTNL